MVASSAVGRVGGSRLVRSSRQAVREDLDAEQRLRRVAQERSRILAGIQSFFGMDDEEG